MTVSRNLGGWRRLLCTPWQLNSAATKSGRPACCACRARACEVRPSTRIAGSSVLGSAVFGPAGTSPRFISRSSHRHCPFRFGNGGSSWRVKGGVGGGGGRYRFTMKEACVLFLPWAVFISAWDSDVAAASGNYNKAAATCGDEWLLSQRHPIVVERCCNTTSSKVHHVSHPFFVMTDCGGWGALYLHSNLPCGAIRLGSVGERLVLEPVGVGLRRFHRNRLGAGLLALCSALLILCVRSAVAALAHARGVWSLGHG